MTGPGEFFAGVGPVRFVGPDGDDPLTYRWYDADLVVAGRRMEDHLRMAVCYRHSFVWPGTDGFGVGTLDRPWSASGRDPMAAAREKMRAAFEAHRYRPRRARAGRAPEPPGRPRCGHHRRLPRPARPGGRDAAQPGGEPRLPGRPHLPPRGGDRPVRRCVRLDRCQPGHPAERVGHRPVPEFGGEERVGPLRDPGRGRVRHRWPQPRHQVAPPVGRTGRPVPRSRRRGDGIHRDRPGPGVPAAAPRRTGRHRGLTRDLGDERR